MIELKFTVEDVNKILNGLAQFPYAQVKDLIDSIQLQAAPQVAKPEDKTVEEVAE